MSTALPLPTRLSQGCTKRVKQTLLQARFGDGYFQTAPDGINSIFEEWDIQWENLISTERTTVTAAILSVGATDFMTWTPPGDTVSKKYQIVPDKTAQLYQETLLSGQYYTIQLSLVQVR